MKSKLQAYSLIVCFTAMLAGVVSLGSASYSMVELVKPELTLSTFAFTRHQTNDAYWESANNRHNDCDQEVTRPSEEELSAKRVASYAIALQAESRSGLQSLINALIYFVFSVLVFAIHWRLAGRLKRTD